jgi:hypothetical protein
MKEKKESKTNNKHYQASRDAGALNRISIDRALVKELREGIKPETLEQINETYLPMVEGLLKSIASNQTSRVLHGRAVDKVSQFCEEILRLQDADADMNLHLGLDDSLAKSRIQGTRDKVLAQIQKIETLADTELRERRLRPKGDPMFSGVSRDEDAFHNFLTHPRLAEHYRHMAESNRKRIEAGLTKVPIDFHTGLFVILVGLKESGDQLTTDWPLETLIIKTTEISKQMASLFKMTLGLTE